MHIFSKPEYRILIAVLAIALISDIITTFFIVSNGGVEGNPLIRSALALSPFSLIFIKAIFFVMCLCMASVAAKDNHHDAYVYGILMVPAFVTFCAVFWNIFQIAHHFSII